MYTTLLFFHSVFRWLVLASLVYAIYTSIRGLIYKSVFTKTDDSVRHWVATIAHIQLMIGITLYFKSPAVQNFLHTNNVRSDVYQEPFFFGLIHSLIMLSAVAIITVGSALARRNRVDKDKFKVLLVWYLAGLVLILLAIPWPFSPIVHRPYLRFP